LAQQQAAVPQYAPPPPPQPMRCADCGTVSSIDEVREKGEGSGLGAVAGAVLGGVIGHQFGGGRGKDVATGVGAIAGGMAGHQIERGVRASNLYSVGVTMDDGSYRSVKLTDLQGIAIGAKVRVVGDSLQLR